MKGIVFTEFLGMVENQCGMEVADRVVTKGCPFQHGFTSVGTYDYHHLLSMVRQLSDETNVPSDELVFSFGKYLFNVFFKSYPDSFQGIYSTAELLSKVENVIHLEVKKLYPEGELPEFTFHSADPGCLKMEYTSKRPLAKLAEGLIHASIEHFSESISVECIELDGEPGTHAMFHLCPIDQLTLDPFLR